MIADILFYIFASVLVLGALGVVFARNPMHCVLFMVLTFFNAAALFLLLGAEFLALLLLMVYIGAIAMLFLFVVMTINIDDALKKEGFIKQLPLAACVGVVLAVEMVVSVSGGLFGTGSALPLHLHSSVTANAERVDNIVAVGNVLFTHYAYPFLTVSYILLVAMIGAIVLTHRKRQKVKRQSIPDQLKRTPEESVVLVNPKSGEGIL